MSACRSSIYAAPLGRLIVPLIRQAVSSLSATVRRRRNVTRWISRVRGRSSWPRWSPRRGDRCSARPLMWSWRRPVLAWPGTGAGLAGGRTASRRAARPGWCPGRPWAVPGARAGGPFPYAAPECSVAVVLAHGPVGTRVGLSRYGMRPGASWLLRRGCRAVSSSLMRSGTRFDHCASGREVNQPGTHAPGEAVRGRHLQFGHAPGAEGATFPRENATRQGNMMTFEVACRAGAMRPQETAAWYGHSALAPSAHGGRPRDSSSGHRPASVPRRYVPPGAPPRRGPSSRAP